MDVDILKARVRALESREDLLALVAEVGESVPDKRKSLERLKAEWLERLEPIEVPPAAPIEAPVQAAATQRLVRHRETGHVFIWTPALEGHPDLEPMPS